MNMKLAQVISVTMGLFVGCIVTGKVIKQPMLKEIGEVAALGVVSTGLIVKLNSVDTEKEKQLRKLNQESLEVQARISKTQAELNKLITKCQTQSSRQRLHLSHIQKLQYQQNTVAKQVVCIEAKLAKHEKNESQKPEVITKKLKTAPIQSIVKSQESVTRVYIDGNNLNFAMDGLQIDIDYEALRIEFSQNASHTNFKYYTGVHSPMSEGQRRFIDYLEAQRYEVVELPILRRHDSNKFKTVGDDVKITVDMIGEVKTGDDVILISGDGDFIPAVEEIQRRGVKVTIVAKKSMLSEQLSQIADEVIYLDDIQYKIAKYRKLDVA
jgi:uncharacterized LabA/DUF88 family protein